MAGPSFNKVLLIGRLTRDPEKRVTKDGISVARFTLAVDRRTTEKRTDFIEIIAWRKLAEIVANILKKGILVAVEGSLHIRDYETQTGEKRRVAEIIAQNIQFLSFPKDMAPAPSAEKEGISEIKEDLTGIEDDISLDESFIDMDKE